MNGQITRFQRRVFVLDAQDGKIQIEADGHAVFCPKDKRVAFFGRTLTLWDPLGIRCPGLLGLGTTR